VYSYGNAYTGGVMEDNLQNAKLNFIYKAIEDAQQTVKFTDTKTTMAFIALGIFVSMIGTGLPNFAKYYWYMPEFIQIIFVVAITIFLVCVGASIFLTVKVITPRSNPSNHLIIKEYKPKGLFYIWELNYHWKDGFIDRKEIKLQTSFEDYHKRLLEIKETIDIEKELIFELLKVSYIRELKIVRLKYMVRWEVIAVLISLILVFLHLIGLSCYMPGL
jgi:hypothetical protein